MKKPVQQNPGLGRVVLLMLACASLVAGPMSASSIGSGGVSSARFSDGKLVLVCSHGVEMTVPDGTYKSRKGGALSFKGGRPVRAMNPVSTAWLDIQSARIDSSGRLMLKSDKAEWFVPDGDFETEEEHKANIDLQNKVHGFRAKGGKIVEVTYYKEGHEAR